MNPALDVTYVAGEFTTGEDNRVERVHVQAGGKAVNVARVLRMLGREVLVTGIAGGETGRQIESHLDAWQLPHRLVRCRGDSRRTVTALSTRTGRATAYNEPGPLVTEQEWHAFRGRFLDLASGAAAVVLAGSLPRGVTARAYAELAAQAAEAGSALIVDAPGQVLPALLAARPILVKPNERECAQAVAHALPLTETQAAAAARRLRDLGANDVAVSLGSRGLVAATDDGDLWAVPPPVSGNPVGAGDAALAALVDGHLASRPWEQRLVDAAATSAAAVRQETAGVVDQGDVRELADQVTVKWL